MSAWSLQTASDQSTGSKRRRTCSFYLLWLWLKVLKYHLIYQSTGFWGHGALRWPESRMQLNSPDSLAHTHTHRNVHMLVPQLSSFSPPAHAAFNASTCNFRFCVYTARLLVKNVRLWLCRWPPEMMWIQGRQLHMCIASIWITTPAELACRRRLNIALWQGATISKRNCCLHHEYVWAE